MLLNTFIIHGCLFLWWLSEQKTCLKEGSETLNHLLPEESVPELWILSWSWRAVFLIKNKIKKKNKQQFKSVLCYTAQKRGEDVQGFMFFSSICLVCILWICVALNVIFRKWRYDSFSSCCLFLVVGWHVMLRTKDVSSFSQVKEEGWKVSVASYWAVSYVHVQS